MAAGCHVQYIEDEKARVDVEIQSSLNEGGHPPLLTRFSRFAESKIKSQIDFSKPRNITNQQPFGNARCNIFYSAENHRPPPGSWDAYLTFDTYDFDGKNAYFPLWWLTSTDLLGENQSPFLGKPITIKQLTSPRRAEFETRKNFCAVFAGKAWPFRVHAINELSKIGRVDVFGDLSRNRVVSKNEIAKDYRFVLCFENDIYPGYVTEKLPEAWATGSVPLYWGEDRTGSFNSRAYLNLNNFNGFSQFLESVSLLNANNEAWSEMAAEPLITTKPSLEEAIRVLHNALRKKRLI